MTYLVLRATSEHQDLIIEEKKAVMMIAGYTGDECCARVVWPAENTFSFTPFPEPSRTRALWILSGKTIPIMNANFAPSRNTFKTKNVLPPPRQHASARSVNIDSIHALIEILRIFFAA
ncbi:hypothetical protein CPB85DRAFT_1256888 [Mucidula mucida]|nr:hypothetical protein CPB85DRAFT_1256888 [Mucidula mucida]